MKSIKSILTAVVITSATASANAGITSYEATSYSDGKKSHALWTNKDFGDNRFKATKLFLDVDDMGSEDIADDTARLYGRVKSGSRTARIDLVFSGAMSEIDKSIYRYKKERGLGYNDLLANNTNPLFWANVEGIIRVGSNTYDVDRHVLHNSKLFTFQMGYGANAKSKTDFGGSSWIQTCKNGVEDDLSCMDSHHWDLNLKLTPVDVPEPGSLALIALGLAGVLSGRRFIKK